MVEFNYKVVDVVKVNVDVVFIFIKDIMFVKILVEVIEL